MIESSVVDMNNVTIGLYPQSAQETQWTDALVRWTAANHNLENDDDDKNDDGIYDEEEDLQIDDENSHDSTPFQSNSPSQLFSRSFSLDGNSTIHVDLQGHDEQSDTIYVSTGVTLWRSSELLCEYLIHDGTTRLQQLRRICKQDRGQDNLRILELGSGLGLVGIFLQKMLELQPRETENNNNYNNNENDFDCIVLTDGDTNALRLLRQNVQSNNLLPMSSSSPFSRITVEQLIWGRATAESFLQQQQRQQQHHHHCQRNQTFDLLLAADAIYVLANVKPLMETVNTLLQKPSGELWFSYCRRRQVSVQIQDVLTEATSIGLDYELVLEDDDIVAYIFRWKPLVSE